MSIQLIRQYHAKVERIIRYGDSRNESALRKPFQDLLEQCARPHDARAVARHLRQLGWHAVGLSIQRNGCAIGAGFVENG